MPAQGEHRSTETPRQPVGVEDPSTLPPGQAFKTAWGRLAELGEFARHYLAAQTDLLKLRLLNLAILAGLGVIGLFGAIALIVTLIVMVCSGLAELIAAALDHRMWAGNLIVGGGLLVVLGLGAWLGLRMIRQKHLTQTRAKYELRHKQQRDEFGQSAFERSQAGIDENS
jgi:hypothetical protein